MALTVLPSLLYFQNGTKFGGGDYLKYKLPTNKYSN